MMRGLCSSPLRLNPRLAGEIDQDDDDDQAALSDIAPREIHFDAESEAGTEGSDQIKGPENLSSHESPGEPAAAAPAEHVPQGLRVSPTVKLPALRLEKDIEYLKQFQVFLYFAVC